MNTANPQHAFTGSSTLIDQAKSIAEAHLPCRSGNAANGTRKASMRAEAFAVQENAFQIAVSLSRESAWIELLVFGRGHEAVDLRTSQQPNDLLLPAPEFRGRNIIQIKALPHLLKQENKVAMVTGMLSNGVQN